MDESKRVLRAAVLILLSYVVISPIFIFNSYDNGYRKGFSDGEISGFEHGITEAIKKLNESEQVQYGFIDESELDKLCEKANCSNETMRNRRLLELVASKDELKEVKNIILIRK